MWYEYDYVFFVCMCVRSCAFYVQCVFKYLLYKYFIVFEKKKKEKQIFITKILNF